MINKKDIAEALHWDNFEFNKVFRIHGHEERKYRICKNGILWVANKEETDWIRCTYLDLGMLAFDNHYDLMLPHELPSEGSIYWYIGSDGTIHTDNFYPYEEIITRWSIGNFYITKEAAEKDVQKWVNFFEQPCKSIFDFS